MGIQVVTGATLQCSFGAAPSTLVVAPVNKVLASTPAANILDNKPLVNIPPFGMCQSLANPMVASATAAAMGVLTPMPCIPATAAPWTPGCPKVLIGNMPALDSNSKCLCTWGGVIQVVNPGQMAVQDG
ncbi:DUF4280 domain-containing protein [Pyxidicoccus fallax]|uniref:DUF4280 domain-containing protein n=1 Tax=Pyxidicoccus fallax TaxID=394095 RepID=A0A848LLT2_9BACT|nr:DUF4280 domain-containing protein [Pyxidicoccus fallax]NMO18642.1 DUF4280 domain-containing protein [Pyxidicoccus fallax]NPC79047.1 DUF4280 domain-containing protein [Pyxidicoccus fallax]